MEQYEEKLNNPIYHSSYASWLERHLTWINSREDPAEDGWYICY